MNLSTDYYTIYNSDELKQELQNSVGDVRQALIDFSKTIKLQNKSKQQKSLVFSLTENEIGDLQQIVPSFSGQDAVDKTLEFIFNFDLEKNSPQDTKKLAGFIQTGLNFDQLNLHITRINTAKSNCKKIITSIKDKDPSKQADLRFYFVHQTCGFINLVTNELYRHLVTIEDPVDSLYFGLEKHNKQSNVLFPKVKATLVNDDPENKVIVRKRHNSLPLFLADNSELLATNKNGKKQAIRFGYLI